MIWILIAGLSGFLAVGAGAFGAHALKTALPPDLLEIFHTAAHYQLLHASALGLCGICTHCWPQRTSHWRVAGWAFLIGSILFCGSLYALALSGQRWLGAITPIGGVSFLVGWATLALAGWSRSKQ